MVFSQDLKEILSEIEHSWSYLLLNSEKRLLTKNKYYSLGSENNISYLPINRIPQVKDNDLWNTHLRQEISVGRWIRAIVQSLDVIISDKEIEEFVYLFIARLTYRKNGFNNFHLIKGDLIKKWYLVDNYIPGGTLGNSCMRNAINQSQVDFYTTQPNISLLIFTSPDNKLLGRALIWHNININNKICTYMDRVYTSYTKDANLFYQYAKNNNWYYYRFSNIWFNGESLNFPKLIFNLDNQTINIDKLPYFDTMKSVNIYKENNDFLPNDVVRILPTLKDIIIEYDWNIDLYNDINNLYTIRKIYPIYSGYENVADTFERQFVYPLKCIERINKYRIGDVVVIDNTQHIITNIRIEDSNVLYKVNNKWISLDNETVIYDPNVASKKYFLTNFLHPYSL